MSDAVNDLVKDWGKRRMHHLFGADGRSVMVAMDHSRRGVAPGLENIKRAVAQVVDGGADAVMTTFGTAREVAGTVGGTGLIMALDSDGPIADYGVEQALRLGADAVELKVFPGNPNETKVADLRRLAARCAEWGMPLMAEPIPVGLDRPEAHTVGAIADVARLAAEAGSDIVKTVYTGPVSEYRRVTSTCYAPLLILGGARGDERAALQLAADALEAGARGVVFGRNVITHPRPDRMVAALVQLVHGGADVDKAMRELRVPVAVGAAGAN